MSDSVEPTRKRFGCSPGCAVVLLGTLGFAAFILLSVFRAPIASMRIRPGMSVEQVMDLADGWSFGRATSGPSNVPVADLWVAMTAYGPLGTETRHGFASRSEMAAALTAEMKQHGRDWTLSFGYISVLPKRVYLTVELTPDGRVKTFPSSALGSLN